MSENPFKEFAQLISEEIEKAKEGIDSRPEVFYETEYECEYEEEELYEDIPAQHAQIVDTSRDRDNIPAAPSDVEDQR